jgi:hypothetical protein
LQLERSQIEPSFQEDDTEDTIRELSCERLKRQTAAHSTEHADVCDSDETAHFVLSAGKWVSPNLWSLLGDLSSAELKIITKMWGEGIVPTKTSVKDQLKKAASTGWLFDNTTRSIMFIG